MTEHSTKESNRDKEFAAGRQARAAMIKWNFDSLYRNKSRDWIDGWSTEDCRLRSKTRPSYGSTQPDDRNDMCWNTGE